jgi:hypothetical protein
MSLTSAVGGQGGNTFTSQDMGGFFPGTIISSVVGTSNPFTINTNQKFSKRTLLKSSQILLSDPNPYYDNAWPGDRDFLKEKFVRFSYRFKYEDGEYSLIAPFTQPAFIPKQDGYLSSGVTDNSVFNKTTAEDTEGFTNGTKQYASYTFGKIKSQEDNISSSTIVEFFENRVQEVDVNIPCEYIISSLNINLKVVEIDILYKESDGLQIKVLDTLSYTDPEILTNNTKTITYNYQSRKPFKNLSEKQTVRVYDKIPVRAKTQSVTGNRVVFGNFIDKPTPPLTLDYSVGVSDKFRLDSIYSNYSSAAAYVNHSVKQNRNYQVGLVLQDKYGRSSDVVLSSLGFNKQEFPAGSGEFFSGSTVFHNYRLTEENIYNWFGDSIKILFNSPIPETVTYANGYPGIYRSGFINAIASNDSANVFALTEWNDDIIVGSIVQGNNSSSVSFSEAITVIDAVNKKITLSNNVTISGDTAITIIGNANPLGWYSYKVVVKQEAEDYYNAYLPNALSGNTQYSIPLSKNLSFLTLTGDNINKIPADLTDVAPEQTQFRTSDIILYPRVAANGWYTRSMQINVSAGENPTRSSFFTIDSIAKLTDFGITTNPYRVSLGEAPKASGIYDAASNPTLAKLSTYGTRFGGWYNNEVFTTNFNQPFPPNNPPFAVDGSFNTNSAITGSRTLSDAPIILGEPVDGCIYPRISTVWQNETEFSKDDPGFQGLITIGKNIPSSWGEWSHPKTSSPTSLLLNYIPAIDTSSNLNNQETSITGCWKAPYSPFSYVTKLIATIDSTTGNLEVELTQDNNAVAGTDTFQSTGSGTGAKIKIIATGANVTTGYKIYTDTANSPRYSNTRILVTDGGTGYAAGDTFTIDPANVTGLALRPSETNGNIVITLKSWLFERPNGLDATTLTGQGSGLRLRGVNVGPWFPSGKFDKTFDQYTLEKTASINNMYWQVTQLGTGYRAGDKISIPAWPEALAAPFEGTFWTDRMVMTLREGDLRQVNLNNPTPISVIEVKPNNSNLDIYWETSTVGLISELNKTINDASSAFRPNTLQFESLGVARNDVFFQESAGPNTIISQFKALSQNGTVLNDATFSALLVKDGNGNPIAASNFTLSNQVVNSVNFGVIKPSPRAFSQTTANNNFTFSLTSTNVDAGITYENNFTFNGSLANESPTVVDSTFNPVTGVQSATSNGTDVYFQFYAINGAYKSVAGQELSWTGGGNRETPFSFQDGSAGTIEFASTPNTDRQRSKQEIKFAASGLGNGVYNETIGVTDASGSGLSSTSITLKVTVTLPPPPPPPEQEGGENN